jgi:hypothetical protein
VCLSNLNASLDQTDRARLVRAELVKIVSAISAFEGGAPSEFYRAEREKFVSGEIRADELHRHVVDYWTRTRSPMTGYTDVPAEL